MMSKEGPPAMLTIAHSQTKRSTYTDDLHGSDDRLVFARDGQTDLVVAWNGRQRCFEIVEFSREEIIVIVFRVDDLDLCHHEASLDYCDGELLDEVTCRVVFRGFVGPGVARLRLVTEGHERMDMARFAEMLRARMDAEAA